MAGAHRKITDDAVRWDTVVQKTLGYFSNGSGFHHSPHFLPCQESRRAISLSMAFITRRL